VLREFHITSRLGQALRLAFPIDRDLPGVLHEVEDTPGVVRVAAEKWNRRDG
jgi:hypothetical protein